jgi:hypothetical protein
MKRLLVALVFVIACGTNVGPSPSSPPSIDVSPVPSQTPSACVLPTDPNSHVYHPDRLQVLNSCISVTGKIDFIRHEPDGDLHIGLILDPQFANLVNSCNVTCANGAEHGDLVIEPVCVTSPTQADAVSSCVGYKNSIVIPPVGSHVEMTGAFVLDTTHGWREIHPLVEVHTI